ncbi:MAG: hypothetical protein MUE85_08735 [Microscillaceae bacterium]|jgi:hypothetical protein|nr:hypothetical protein [Microscillaceae bacterium]
MQINYNILWIDDQIDAIKEDGDLDKVESFLIEKGFLCKIIPLKDDTGLNDALSRNIFDLIISDFNIREGLNGADIVKQIRDKHAYAEVLFYSGNLANRSDVANQMLSLDRVSYFSGRKDLVERIIKLIALSLGKLLELNATRGLITAETSELDVKIEELTIFLVRDKLKLPQEDIDKIINFYIDDFLRKSPDNFSKKYNSEGFKGVFRRIDANRKWSIFRDLLKKISDEQTKSFLENNKTYKEQVIDIRNKFAHAKAIEKGGKLYLEGFSLDGEHFEFDEKACVKIRQDIIKHRNFFEELINFLSYRV